MTARQPDTLITTPPGNAALDDVEVGQQVDDFDLLMGLGSGAFARVFLARQRSMQRLVAVKISHDNGNEPQTLAQLDHHYIVRVFDQRLLEDRRLRLLYMQYVPGGTLLGVLRRVRVDPGTRTGAGSCCWTRSTSELRGEGRDPAHRLERAGRDRRADLAGDGRVAGAATGRRARLRRQARRPAPRHQAGQRAAHGRGRAEAGRFQHQFQRQRRPGRAPLAYFGGSLAYMSPEQLEACHRGLPGTAADLDTRSDIFALGVMLWELLYRAAAVRGRATCRASRSSHWKRCWTAASRGIDPEFSTSCPTTARRAATGAAEVARTGAGATGGRPVPNWPSSSTCAWTRRPATSSIRRRTAGGMRMRRWALPILVIGIAVPNAAGRRIQLPPQQDADHQQL